MEIKNILKTKAFKIIAISLGLIVIVLSIFQAGMVFGYRRAQFSDRLGNNYNRIFNGSPERPFGTMRKGAFPISHGANGKIIRTDFPVIIIEDKDNIEKTILIQENTIIKKFRNTIKPEDLKIDDAIIVIGTPNKDGQIEAKLIRLMPSVVSFVNSNFNPRTR